MPFTDVRAEWRWICRQAGRFPGGSAAAERFIDGFVISALGKKKR